MASKGRIVVFVLLVLAMVVPSACAPAPPDPEVVDPVDEDVAAPGPDEVVTLRYLSAGTAEVEQDWNEKWVAKFNEEHDNIQIDYILVSWQELLPKVTAMIAAGDPPDFGWYAPAQIKEWYHGGLLEPLDDYVGDVIDQYVEPIREPESSDIWFDGNYYGVPFCLAGLAVVVRRDIFAEAGYDVAELDEWTFDDFIQIAADVDALRPDQYAYHFAMGHPRVARGKNWPKWNGLHDLTDFSNREAYLAALQLIVDMFPYTPEEQVRWEHADDLTAYMNSVVAMNDTGSFFFGDIRDRAPDVMNAEATTILPWPRGPHVDQNYAG